MGVFTVLPILLLFISISYSKGLAWYSTEPGLSSSHPVAAPIHASTAIDFCQLPSEAGKCSQQLVRYYYDAAVDECKRFTYSGCGGNSNRFMRRAHCRNRCVKRLDKHLTTNENGKDLKQHRRTVTSATPSTTKENDHTSLPEVTTDVPPATKPVERVNLVESGHSSGLCRDCDPIFGTCNNGQCGCLKGFRSLGKVCIDLNECDNGPICGPNSRCVNTVGSYTCECDSGFLVDGACKIGPESCMDEFDVNLTEEDCNNGHQDIRYYFDSESGNCKQFFFGGCRTKSRNFFADLQTCDILCASQQRNYLSSKSIPDNSLPGKVASKANHYKIDLLSSPASLVQLDKPLSAADWPLRPITVRPELNLDFSKSQTPSIQERIAEAIKAEKILKEITPSHNQCNLNLDPLLREECISAEWAERFFWNNELSECEPFWYDSSCDPRETVGKNYFETFEKCKSACTEKDEYSVPPETNNEKTENGNENETENEKESSGIQTTEEIVPKEKDAKSESDFFNIDQKPKSYLEDEIETQSTTEANKINPNVFNPNKFLEKEKEQQYESPTKPSREEVTQKTPEVPEEITTSTCDNEFDSELRSECTSAEWGELFFWNKQFKECEAFWYDASCGAPDFEKKNLFPTWEDCNKKCILKKTIGSEKTIEETAHTTLKPIELNEETTISTTGTPSTSVTTPTHIPILLTETQRPKYNQNDPLNLILNEALNPAKSSMLPEKLPPKHEKTFLNFGIKSEETATTKFDRLKYMAAFKKKLLALPDGFATVPTESIPKTTPIKTETPSESSGQKTTKFDNVETTTTFEDFVNAEKKKIENTLRELDRPADFCDEPLHPKLEEDCNGDKWEIRWFFNPDRGACKSFWYGGCELETKNVFQDHANCRHACAHKYSAPDSFSQHVAIPPGILSTPPPISKDRLTTSLKLIYPHSEDLFPSEDMTKVVEIDGNLSHQQQQQQKEVYEIVTTTSPPEKVNNIVNVLPGNRRTEEPSFYSHIDKVILDMKKGDHPGFAKPEEFVRRIEAASNDFVKYDFAQPDVVTILDKPGPTMPLHIVKIIRDEIEEKSTTRNPSTRSINDPCDDEYDPKWDEDCLGDQWEVRSYFDEKSGNCKQFWYGGCQTSSRNIWFDKETCKHSCLHKFPTTIPLVNSEHHFETHDEDPLPSDSSTSSDTVIFVSESANVIRVSSKLNNLMILKIKARLATEHELKVDIGQKMADIKREHEGREDLEYSKIVHHPVTIAADCLEVYNESIAKPCNDGKEWKNRYYYDKDTRTCQMFWSNGFFSTSKNNFDDLETCQWKCEGRHPQPAGKSCLDKFDERYLEDCRHGEFTSRFYFDHDRKKCVAFHWGGCQSKSQNFFADMTVCQDLCESPPRKLTEACVQPFDENYKNTCSNEKHQQYYYFDMISGICKMFWFGNCKGENQNIFNTLESCQWICERKREERKPALCADKFDEKYTESCGNGQWVEKWHFDQSTGDCVSFWWDGCTSSSQNIFPDEKSCTSNCKHPGFEISSKLATEESKFRCLEPVEIGSCQETYPAFYYDRSSNTCRPFAYSGCGGNANRFMTMSQCENLCFAFNQMNDAEVDCHLPMHVGYGKNDESCLAQAGYRFYFDRNYGKCSQMWYLGCGGNANNFYSYDICQRTCSSSTTPRELERKTRASSEVCFETSGDRGTCGKNASTEPLQRWTYSQQLTCVKFTYSGCGGNRNRFANEEICQQTCKGLRNSHDPRVCSFPPDSGSCNQLRYVWFYNATRGSCDQFLYGGCGGNSNRFDTFEVCQKSCEVTGTDSCMESLDRGSWCEAMSNRYYFNKRARQCKGFHYTGCGKSGNNFLTKEECQEKCEKRFPRSAMPGVVLPKKKAKSKSKLPAGYSGSKPKDKTPMIRHINLNGSNQTYFKSDPQWMDYNFCYGYRYNVTGRDTVLNVHFCALQGSLDCISESYRTTDGEEFCNVLRPFLRGQHLYSWYFGIDSVNPMYRVSDALSGRIQRKNETIGAILVLKANHCYEIC